MIASSFDAHRIESHPDGCSDADVSPGTFATIPTLRLGARDTPHLATILKTAPNLLAIVNLYLPMKLARLLVSYRFAFLVPACTVLLATLALASPPNEDPPAAPPEAETKPQAEKPVYPGSWPPFVLNASKDDWIRLDSGEWLRGEFQALEDEDLEFESDSLDDLELDWDDVVEVRCSSTMTCLLEDKRTLTGRLTVRGDSVIVRTPNRGSTAIPRARLLSVIRGRPEERNFWSGKISFGLSTRSGNTDQLDYSGYAEALRRTPATRTTLEYRGAYGELESEKSADNHRFDGSFAVMVTRRLYVTPFQIAVLRDEFQNIEYRVSPGAGLGYEVVDNGKTTLEVGSGVAYQYTVYDSVEAGEDRRDRTVALLGALDFDHEITSDVDFDLSYDITVPVPDSQTWNHSLRASIEVDLPRSLELDVTGIWDRLNRPERDSDGNRPEEDDFKLTVGIGWKF